MISSVARKNLHQDKKVLGTKWLTVYNSYFSDEKNISQFIRVVKPVLPEKSLDILYVASASGLLGEKLLKALGIGSLTLVDISERHLAINKNPKTKKICCDLSLLNLKKKFDLVIMRSSLDYFPTADLQIKILKTIKKHLKLGGLFINQPAYISSKIERDIVSQIYNQTFRIGDRYFQSGDLKILYEKAGFRALKRLGWGKELQITQAEHIERYGISGADVDNIQALIKGGKKYMQVTKSGYRLRFKFPIFSAK